MGQIFDALLSKSLSLRMVLARLHNGKMVVGSRLESGILGLLGLLFWNVKSNHQYQLHHISYHDMATSIVFNPTPILAKTKPFTEKTDCRRFWSPLTYETFRFLGAVFAIAANSDREAETHAEVHHIMFHPALSTRNLRS